MIITRFDFSKVQFLSSLSVSSLIFEFTELGVLIIIIPSYMSVYKWWLNCAVLAFSGCKKIIHCIGGNFVCNVVKLAFIMQN